MEKYEPNDIYNADETGLFWQMLPKNLLGFIGKKAHGSKQPKKNCITLLVGANMSGTDKLPLLAIGKSKKPRAFKNVRKLPVDYEANKKAWMRSNLFEQYLHKLDRKMKSDERKIVMVLDNCPGHPHVNLENVELAFLPPNTTSRMQSTDAASFAISNYITIVYLLVDDYKLLKMVMKILNRAYLTVFWLSRVHSHWQRLLQLPTANVMLVSSMVMHCLDRKVVHK